MADQAPEPVQSQILGLLHSRGGRVSALAVETVTRREWAMAQRGHFTSTNDGQRWMLRGTAGIDARFVPVNVQGMKAPRWNPCSHFRTVNQTIPQKGQRTVCELCGTIVSRTYGSMLDMIDL